MGQTLLPEHFYAQEDAIISDAIIRSRTTGLPAHGVVALKWNEPLLSEGVFSIETMTLIMHSGLLISVPGNAKVSPYNLSIPGSVSVPVYCHVIRKEDQSGSENGNWESEAEAEDIPRVVYRLILSSDPTHGDAFAEMKLAEFEKSPETVWQLSENFVPPLLQLTTSPFFQNQMGKFEKALDVFQYKLSQEIAASYISGETLSGAKECMKRAYSTKRFLANIRGQIHLHPYFLYEALQELYTELCFYKDTTPNHVDAPYNHDQLSDISKKISAVMEQMRLVNLHPPYLPFELLEGVYRVKLPEVVRSARDAYFLVQKSHVSREFTFENIKLSAFLRLPLIHKLALQGVPMSKIDRPPFQQPFGPEVDFYRIVEGEEWDRVLKELVLAFYDNTLLGDLKFFLYWRVG